MAIACGGSVVALFVLGEGAVRPLALLIGAIGTGLLALSGVTAWTRLSLRTIGMVAVVLSVGALATAVYLQGGRGSPALGFLVFLPLIVLAAAPDNLVSVVTTGVASVLATLVLTLLNGMPDDSSENWVIPAVAAAGLAVQGSRHHRKVLQSERAADEARIATLEKLTESEALRAGAERLALVGQLASGVAHEINNPLAFATSNLRFIRSELKDADEELLEALRDSEQGLERIAQIVRDLRSAAREDDPGPAADARCTVAAAVDEALRLSSVKLKRVAKVEADIPGDLPEVRFQSRHLVQVLVNLLVNAADAVEDRKVAGRVTLKVERADDAGTRLRVAVEDDGPGFSPESMERLFKPFFTTKAPGRGTGLGLNLSREYARRYGGELRAENREEGGARLALELHAAADAPTARTLPGREAVHIDAA